MLMFFVELFRLNDKFYLMFVLMVETEHRWRPNCMTMLSPWSTPTPRMNQTSIGAWRNERARVLWSPYQFGDASSRTQREQLVQKVVSASVVFSIFWSVILLCELIIYLLHGQWIYYFVCNFVLGITLLLNEFYVQCSVCFGTHFFYWIVGIYYWFDLNVATSEFTLFTLGIITSSLERLFWCSILCLVWSMGF